MRREALALMIERITGIKEEKRKTDVGNE